MEDKSLLAQTYASAHPSHCLSMLEEQCETAVDDVQTADDGRVNLDFVFWYKVNMMSGPISSCLCPENDNLSTDHDGSSRSKKPNQYSRNAQVVDIDALLLATNNPVHDLQMALRSDIIHTATTLMQENLKTSDSTLGYLESYPALVKCAAARGIEISKVMSAIKTRRI